MTRGCGAHTRQLGAPLPEVQLRILQRQWRIALALLKSVQMCRYNAALEQEVPVYNARLKEHLDAMLDRCSSTLADAGPCDRRLSGSYIMSRAQPDC